MVDEKGKLSKECVVYRRRAATPKAPKRAAHPAPKTRNESASEDFLPVAEAAAASVFFAPLSWSPVRVGIGPMSWVKMLFAFLRLSSMKLWTSVGMALYLFFG